MSDLVKDVDVGIQNKTVKDIQECINGLKEESKKDDGVFICDGNLILNRFCSKLELLLQLGLKERLGRGSSDYFSFISESSRSNKNLSDGIRFVKQHLGYKSKLAQGRALMRYSLVHHLLADTVQHCANNTKVISKYYVKPTSIFFNLQLCQQLVGDLYDLNDITFDLDPSVPDLDIQWPIFNRSRHLHSPISSWRLVSSMSRNSIASCASSYQDDATSVQFSCDLSRNGANDSIEEECFEVERREGTPDERNSELKDAELRIQELVTSLMMSEEKNSMYHSQHEGLLQENEKLKSDLESSESLNRDLKQELERLKAQMEEETNSLKSEIERLSRERGEDRAEVEQLREQLLNAEAEKSISEEVMKESLEEVGRMERSLDHVRIEADLQLDDAKQEVMKLKDDVKILVDFLDRMQTACFPDVRPTTVVDVESRRVNESSLDRMSVTLEALFDRVLRAGETNKTLEVVDLEMKVDSLLNDLEKEKVDNAKHLRRVDDLEKSLSVVESEKSNLLDDLESKNEEIRSLSAWKERANKLEEDARRKDKETNETVAEFEEALKSCEVERASISVKMEAMIEEKECRVKELKEDMEVMCGSYKRREILMEETRSGFEKSIEKMQEDHVDEVEILNNVIKNLQAKISDELTLERKHEFETEIGKLDEQLMTAREDIIVVRAEFNEKLEKVNNKLENMEDENASLRNQVTQLSKYNKSERDMNRTKQTAWMKEKKEFEEKTCNLKENFSKILSDKRHLWEKCQELMDRKDLEASFKWMDSSKVDNCQLCNVAFSLSVRKHHCRQCGNVFCANCSNNWIDAPHSSSKSRTCNVCNDLAVDDQTTILDDDDLTTTIGNRISNVDNSRRILAVSNDSFGDMEPDPLLPPEACTPHVINASAGGLSTLSKLTGGVKNVAVWATSTAVSSFVKTTGHVSGMFARGQHDACDQVAFDDRFDIITPDEIIESRIRFLEDNAIVLDIIDPMDDDDDYFEVMHEIPCDKMLLVPINLKLNLNKATSLHWSFHSEPKGITFGISCHGSYEKSATEPSNSMLASLKSSMVSSFSSAQAVHPFTSFTLNKSEIVYAFEKYKSHLGNVSGILTPKCAGVYALLFDNTKSSMMTKKIFLKLKLIPSSSVALPSDC